MDERPGMVMSRRHMLGLGTSLLASAVLAGCSTNGASNGTGAPEALLEEAIPATADNVRLIGRTFEEEGVTWLAQSGSAVEFEVTGSHVQLEVVGDESVGNEPDLRPRFAVLVDGEVVLDDTLSKRSRIVEVPTDGPLEGAVVELIHLSEAIRGLIGVRGIFVESDDDAPIAPTAGKALGIGFVGDSITCAYGVEAAGNDDPFKTTTENFMKSYAYLTAQELDADYDVVCYSGYGIISGWSGDDERNKDKLIPRLYDLVVEGHEQTWDYESHQSDVVVVNLGTNDFTYTGYDKARMGEFSNGYVVFLKRVRDRNPQSLIICTLGTMSGSELLYPSVEHAVQNYKSLYRDEHVMCYLSDPIDMDADGCGTNGHPNEATQRKTAEKLVGIIRDKLDL